ncbi:hypothetical protein DAI22_10g141800 [Oryza sativa Japonica Group]|nr:hypothetical protein DAI22_10g141800 [Oryza sativa Japonica Group]
MSLWKVLLMVIALICALHTTSGRPPVVGYPAPRPNGSSGTRCYEGCNPPGRDDPLLPSR